MSVTRHLATPPLRVGDFMTAGVVAAAPEEPLSRAADRMRHNQVGALSVMAEERMVGIVSERDLLRAMANGVDPRATPVSACMTSHPFTISPDAEAAEAARRMVQWWVRHLPVVQDGRVVGIISARDLLVLEHATLLEELAREPW